MWNGYRLERVGDKTQYGGSSGSPASVSVGHAITDISRPGDASSSIKNHQFEFEDVQRDSDQYDGSDFCDGVLLAEQRPRNLKQPSTPALIMQKIVRCPTTYTPN